ncbi:hypothetical protein [uncultured Pedobacter sp.]|nr:hypothetical protein [uncultured Pedobacter sp.]
MKMVDNADHVKGRDKELGFKITEDFVKPYFGRDVNTDKLEAVFGDITDDDIAESRSEIIADNIYCSNCEKKFGRLESFYAKTLEIFNDSEYISSNEPFLSLLFWSSIVWRISSYKKMGFSLTEKEQEHLRKILVNSLKDEYTLEENRSINEIKNLRYAILRSPQYFKDNETSVFFHPKHRFPYCLLIGEYTVFFFMKINHLRNPEQSFFGLEKFLKKASLNSCDIGENIFPISYKDMDLAKDKFIDFVNERRLKGLFFNLDELHVKLGGEGKKMPMPYKMEILAELLKDNKKSGRSFTREDIVSVTTKVLLKT